MSSGGSGPVSSSPSASSSTSSPPVHGGNMDSLMADGVVAKIEELDNDDDELRNVPPLPSPSTESGEPSKRGRGRPRKHPLQPIGTQTKITKGRSKTGCITCRRRKKKCDETKPDCNNCIKNAVVCEGYPERTVWQSGRQKAEGGEPAHRTYTPSDRLLTPFTGRNFPSAKIVRFANLPCLIDGVETRIDRALLDHFVRNVSRILTLFNDATNPFQEMLLPLALENRGLMHSLLCLSGSHLSNTDPRFSIAQHHHFGKAMEYLRCDPAVTGQIPIAGDPTIATTLILCLNSICKGETEGEYRPHLDAARHMLSLANSENRNNNPSFSNFLYEFFMYHDVINSVTTLDRRPLLLMENYTLPAFIIQPEAGALLGVLDGLFGYLSKITLLRDHIRGRKARGDHPAVDYEVLSQAVAIDSEIRDWVPAQTPASHRYIAAQLYRQSTWVYLYRTIMPSTASPKIDVAVEEGLDYLRHLPENSGTQSILLMPLFILGCAAFNPKQRPEISQRFVGLHEYSGLGNIVTAHEVVKKVWALMDSGEDEMSWDWEQIIQEMGYDFLVT